MSNPRNINNVLQTAAATSPAKLPAIQVYKSNDKALCDVLSALKERSEVREGARGNPFERTVTLRQLDELGLVRTGPSPSRVAELAGIIGQTKAGEFVLIKLDDLIKAITDRTNETSGNRFGDGGAGGGPGD